MSNGLFRLRVRYTKQGRLAYLSHLELIRALERAIRRADLPYAITQGFHPHMKNAFGPALPVGCGGTGEYLDVWLTQFVEPDEVLAALAKASPADLAPVEATYIPESEKSLTAALTLSSYSALCMPAGECDSFASKLETVIADKFTRGEIFVPGKKKDRTFELETVLCEAPVVTVSDNGVVVTFGIRTSNEGSLRSDVYLEQIRKHFAETYGISFTVRELTRTGLFAEDK